MYARLWLYITIMSVGMFAIGMSLTAIMRWPVAGLIAGTFCVSATVTLGVRLYQSLGIGRSQKHHLLHKICRQTTLLIEEGYELLIPHGGDTATLWVRIWRHDGTIIIEKEARNGTLFRYSIRENDSIVRRSVLGYNLTASDHAWCRTVLTNDRLARLLEVVSGHYAPVRSAASL